MTEPPAGPADVIVINDELQVPLGELRFRASRAGGPGGQHVNTSSTRIQLEFDVANSRSLSDEQRARIFAKLRNRIAANGVLRLSSAESRSQHQNREDVVARFQHLLARALEKPKPRKPTSMPRAAREARLRRKKRRGETKRQRGPVHSDE